jgi:hypothetical protein
MKTRVAALCLALVAPLASCRNVTPAGEETEVRAVVQAYFDGLMSGSPETLDRAFHPGARLIGIGGRGTLAIIPFQEWKEVVTSDGARGPDGFTNEILSVDVHGVAATVKTRLTWPEVVYVDYLSLIFADGEWKIVNKIWDAKSVTAADAPSG